MLCIKAMWKEEEAVSFLYVAWISYSVPSFSASCFSMRSLCILMYMGSDVGRGTENGRGEQEGGERRGERGGRGRSREEKS